MGHTLTEARRIAGEYEATPQYEVASLKRRQTLGLLRFRECRGADSKLGVFYDLLAATGCVARFERAGNVDALLNLGAMSRLVVSWDEYGSTRNFYPFQEYLKLLREGGVDPVTAPPEDAVPVMTIHQAKGLEFPRSRARVYLTDADGQSVSFPDQQWNECRGCHRAA